MNTIQYIYCTPTHTVHIIAILCCSEYTLYNAEFWAVLYSLVYLSDLISCNIPIYLHFTHNIYMLQLYIQFDCTLSVKTLSNSQTVSSYYCTNLCSNNKYTLANGQPNRVQNLTQYFGTYNLYESRYTLCTIQQGFFIHS